MIHRFGNIPNKADRAASSQRQISMRSDVEQRFPLFQVHDPDSADMAWANKTAQEIINISGANVIVYPRTDNADFDEVWEEDPNPTYGAGRHMKAYFSPKPLETELTMWGADAPNQTEVIFCRDEVYRIMGQRMIRIGDIIELPYNSMTMRPDRYRVNNAYDVGNFRYNWLYHGCKVENITDDITIDIDHK